MGSKGTIKSVADQKRAGRWPTLLTNRDIWFDISQIEQQSTLFYKRLQNLQPILQQQGSILASSTSVPTLSPIDSLSSALGSLISGINAFTSAYPGKVIQLRYESTNTYLPLTLSSLDTTIRVVSQQLVGDVSSTPAVSNTITVNTATEQIDYQVIRRDLDNEILGRHLAATRQYYVGIIPSHRALLNQLGSLYDRRGSRVDALLQADTAMMALGARSSLPFNIDVVRELEPIEPTFTNIENLHKHILKANNKWLTRWLWYTGGQATLNPFPITDPSPRFARIDLAVRDIDAAIAALTATTPSLSHESPADIRARLTGRRVTLLAERDSVLAQSRRFDVWQSAVAIGTHTLYTGSWHTSTVDKLNWFHHTDAADGFKRPKDTDKDLPDMLALTDEVICYTHNVKAGSNVTVTASPVAFTPTPALTNTLAEVAGQLALGLAFATPATTLAVLFQSFIPLKQPITKTTSEVVVVGMFVPSYSSSKRRVAIYKYDVQHQLAYLFRYNKRGRLVAVLDSIAKKPEVSNKAELDSLSKRLTNASRSIFINVLYDRYRYQDQIDYDTLVQTYTERRQELAWLLVQTDPPAAWKIKVDKTPNFRTVVNRPEAKKLLTESSRVPYVLTLDGSKEPQAEGEYKKYKATRILPTIGIGYVLSDRTGTTFDEKTGQFVTANRFDNIEALVGVKWYPSFFTKTNPARSMETRRLIQQQMGKGLANYNRGNTFLNTIFFTGGLGIRNQFLRNYYVGAGIDLVPGLSFHAGGNFIFQKRYQLESSRILSERDVPQGYGYIALSFDPAIVSSLIKILTVSK